MHNVPRTLRYSPSLRHAICNLLMASNLVQFSFFQTAMHRRPREEEKEDHPLAPPTKRPRVEDPSHPHFDEPLHRAFYRALPSPVSQEVAEWVRTNIPVLWDNRGNVDWDKAEQWWNRTRGEHVPEGAYDDLLLIILFRQTRALFASVLTHITVAYSVAHSRNRFVQWDKVWRDMVIPEYRFNWRSYFKNKNVCISKLLSDVVKKRAPTSLSVMRIFSQVFAEGGMYWNTSQGCYRAEITLTQTDYQAFYYYHATARLVQASVPNAPSFLPLATFVDQLLPPHLRRRARPRLPLLMGTHPRVGAQGALLRATREWAWEPRLLPLILSYVH